MSSFLDDTISKIGRRAAQRLGRTAGDTVDSLQRGRGGYASGLSRAYWAARESKKGRQFMGVVRHAAATGPVGELAKYCGRAGVAGAVIDGAIGGVNAFKFVRAGQIDGAQAARHVAAETGCGFVTSASGTAGTIAVYMVTGSMGPAAMVVGMGASMGARYGYRRVVGETLPEASQVQNQTETQASSGAHSGAREGEAANQSDVIEQIGPRSEE